MESVRIVKSPLHEDGIVATRILNGDEIAFIERPLYCQQTLQNKNDVLICSYCFSFLGTPELQMKVLLRIESRLSLLTTPGLNSNYNICGCLNTCGELYCSEHCRNLHQQNGHILLCTGTITEQEAPSHTLILFKTYAVETNEVFLLVAEVFASIISKFTINKIPIEEAVSFFREYVHNPWWEVVTVPDDREEGEFRDLLHTLAKDNYDLLSDALQLESTGLNSILSFDFMSRYD